jgi:hypothetical protein
VFRSSPWNVILFEKQRPCVTETASRSPATFHDRYGLALDLITRQCTDTLERLRARTFASPYHGWLTPAAPGARTQVVANGRWCFATAFRFPRGAYAPPLLCCNANVCRRKTIFSMHKRTSDQERRASARRGFHCAARTMHSELRPASNDHPIKERRASARRGFRFALATASDSCGLITFRPAQSLPGATAGLRQPLLVHARKSSQMGGGALQRRSVSHGGLTPPALGFVCGRRCRCGLTADESVSFSHGWLTPAALVSGCERLSAKKTIFAMHKRTAD